MVTVVVAVMMSMAWMRVRIGEQAYGCGESYGVIALGLLRL